jgi:BMFP domain-containing protein YqiC
MYQNIDEKLAFNEKNNLETEKKMLNYSKEYIGGIRELMSQSQQKTEIEIRALKSILEANIARLDGRLEETLKVVEDSTGEVKSIHKEVRNQYNDLDGFMRENFDGIENKLVNNSAEIERSKEKIKKLSQTIKLLLNDNVQLIESKIAESLKNTDFKFTKYIDDLNDNMRSLTAKVENLLMVNFS